MRPIPIILLALVLIAMSCNPGAQNNTTPQHSPKLCVDLFERGACGEVRTWAQVLPFDTLQPNTRALRVFAIIDPNNTFVTRVVVSSGDAPAGAGNFDINLVMEDQAVPVSDRGRFNGNVSNYDTRPMTWAVTMPLRGLTPDVVSTTTVTTPATGIPQVDAFLATLGVSRTYVDTQTTPGTPMDPGARVKFQFHVFFKRDPAGSEFGVLLPVRNMTYGPQGGRVKFDNSPVSGTEGADVNVRLSKPAPYRLYVRFHSDPDGAVEVLVNGNQVDSIEFQPNESVRQVRVRKTNAQSDSPVMLFAKSSGWVADPLTVLR